MPYNPFATPATATATPHKLLDPRRPALFDVALAPLEWSGGEARKRPREEANGDVRVAHAEKAEPVFKEQVVRVERVVQVEPMTLMGVAPLADDRVRYVVNFILQHVTSPSVEVEAKLGLLMEKHQDTRAVNVVPVLCETPIKPESNSDTRFSSDVGEQIFRTLNAELNKRVEATAELSTRRVQYLRTREMDLYWPGRVRESKERRTDAMGNEVFETVRVQTKRRLGDLNILCPGSIVDVRYSASLEQESNVPQGSAPPQMQRMKDRISYKYEYLSIDITAVEMQETHNPESVTTYEVEVEIDSSAHLYDEVCKYRTGDASSKLFDIAESLVNTVRLLVEEVRKMEETL